MSSRILFLGLLVLFGYLQYRLWCEPGSVLEMLRFQDKLSTEQANNEKLKQQNNELNLQVQHLHHGPDAVESRARQELGMIKQGEVFYQIAESTQHTESK